MHVYLRVYIYICMYYVCAYEYVQDFFLQFFYALLFSFLFSDFLCLIFSCFSLYCVQIFSKLLVCSGVVHCIGLWLLDLSCHNPFLLFYHVDLMLLYVKSTTTKINKLTTTTTTTTIIISRVLNFSAGLTCRGLVVVLLIRVSKNFSQFLVRHVSQLGQIQEVKVHLQRRHATQWFYEAERENRGI